MIKNDRQAGIIRARVHRLIKSQDDIKNRLDTLEGNDQALVKLELKAVDAEIARMEEELFDYESLKEGRSPVGVARTLTDLPRLLIRARIAHGLTQAQLAERLGLKEQQVQRYESTDYESASLTRLTEVASALDLRFSSDFNFDTEAHLERETPPEAAELLSALSKHVGLDPDFVWRRIGAVPGEASSGLISRLAHVFGWRPEDLAAQQVELPRSAVYAYKKPKRADETKTALLASYARFLADLISDVVDTSRVELPEDSVELHDRLRDIGDGHVTLTGVLELLWDSGVPVVPLNEPGAFDAGYYKLSQGRDVIVVNSVRRDEARWMFYILHEVGHILDPETRGFGQLESLETNIEDDGGEERANRFASDAIFGGRSEELFELAREKADGDIRRMQRAVQWVARNESVDVGALALNTAYRLSEQGENWWGAAHNLQHGPTHSWEVTRDFLVARIDWSLLEPIDADLLSRALETTPPLMASVGDD